MSQHTDSSEAWDSDTSAAYRIATGETAGSRIVRSALANCDLQHGTSPTPSNRAMWATFLRVATQTSPDDARLLGELSRRLASPEADAPTTPPQRPVAASIAPLGAPQ